VASFFAQRHANFFIASFGYAEGWKFADEVLKRYPAKPKILVINASPFFNGNLRESSDGTLSEPGRYVLEHPISSSIDAKVTAAMQPLYADLCRGCGREPAVVRSRETGQWDALSFDPDNRVGKYPLTPTAAPSENLLREWAVAAEGQARELLRNASARCVVFTDIPYDGPVGAYARRLAAQLNVAVVIPELAGLRTFDKTHLDSQSATAWSDTFLQQLDGLGAQCGAW
jgi:hypothetical protein